MFKSIPRLESRVQRVLRSYEDFVTGTADPVLNDPRGNAALVGDVISLGPTIGGFGDEATSILNDPEFAALSTEMQEDIVALSEECEVAVAELVDVANEDAVWETADKSKKRNLANSLPLKREHSDVLKARLKHDIRKQNGGQKTRVIPVRAPKPEPEVIVEPGGGKKAGDPSV